MSTENISPKYIKFLMYIVVVVLLNIAGMTLFFRVDLTANKIYSLSDASKKVVATLSEPLTIKVFFTRDMPAPHNNTERYLRDLLGEYAQEGGKYFNYKFYNVTSEEGGSEEEAITNQELASSYGISPVQIQAVEKDEIKFKKAFMGLVILHGDMIEKIPAITTTDRLEYRLTTAILKLNNKISSLNNLKDNVKVKLYMSSELKNVASFMGLDQLPSLPGSVEKIVGKLNEKMYGKLEFSYMDPKEKELFEDLVKKYNFMALKWPDLPERKIRAGRGLIGMVMDFEGREKVLQIMDVAQIPLFGPQYDLLMPEEIEEMIGDTLESLIGINRDMGYISGHGTLQTAGYSPMGGQNRDGLTSFSGLVSKNYTIRDISLKDENIPTSLESLVIARPTEKFTDYELYQIDQALMRGTNLMLFLDSFNEVMPQSQQAMMFGQGPQYIPIDTGLEKLLEHYGIRIEKSYVLDENCYKQRMQQGMGGGETSVYFAPIIQEKNINNDVPYMSNIKELVALKVSPLTIDEDRLSKNNIKAEKLISSSEKSWEMKGRINLSPAMMSPPSSDEEKTSYPIAYMLEGEFPSFFDGKPMPEKVVEKEDEEGGGKEADLPDVNPELAKVKGEGAFLSKGKNARVFVMASSAMLQDNLVDPEGSSNNALFIMNVLDDLNDRGEIASMRSKSQQYNPLYETDGMIKTFVKTFNIAVLPAMVVVFGLAVWVRRSSKRKKLKIMFAK